MHKVWRVLLAPLACYLPTSLPHQCSPIPAPVDWQFCWQKVSLSLAFLLRTPLHHLWRKRTPKADIPLEKPTKLHEASWKTYCLFKLQTQCFHMVPPGMRGAHLRAPLHINHSQVCKTDRQGLTLADSSLTSAIGLVSWLNCALFPFKMLFTILFPPPKC